jgi:hypothetical protein
MSLIKNITISSADKDSGSKSNSEFQTTVKERYLVQSVQKIVLRQALVPNVFYNITDGDQGMGPRTNTIIYSYTASLISHLVTVPPGFYTVNELIAELKTQFLASLNPTTQINITYNSINQKLTFTATGIQIFFRGNSTMLKVLGFTPGVDTIDFGTITPPYSVALNGMPSVFIHCSIAENASIDASAGITSMAVEIPFSGVAYGAYASYISHDVEMSGITYETPRNLNTISVRLRSITGERLDIGNASMSLTFRAYISN